MRRANRKRSKAVKANPRIRRKFVYYVAATLVVGSAVVWFLVDVPKQTSDQPPNQQVAQSQSFAAVDDRFAIPEVTRSRFRNASKDIAYVGSQACVGCHRNEHQTYLETSHSRSLAAIDVSREPPDGEFRHEQSGRHYRVSRDGETLKLREFIQDSDGREVVLADYHAGFSLGSGNHSRMYLVKFEDFLIESPMTWYPRRNVWGMSAGYEKDPQQVGFGREVDAMCLYCHAGRFETIDGDSMRLNVTEIPIGCERCHGPGALHVQERQAQERQAKFPVTEVIDDSIVNPRHLARESQEDICAQCHLSATADVNVSGRSKIDFRPGMKLSDFVVSYRIDRNESGMTVSGQIQQMRLSRCYIDSKTMTCVTCHDPHFLPEKSEKVSYYRNKCLGCHQTDSCGIELTARLKQQMDDNCAICHMPRGSTDIPHFTFTHHRVGIHEPKNDRLTEADKLVPAVDISHLPNFEQQRLLGLAHDVFAAKLAGGWNDETRDDPTYRELSKVVDLRAQGILEEVRMQGLRDPDVEAFFSRLYWRRNPDLCINYAESALRSPHISSLTRKSALYYLASSHFDQRRFSQALPYLTDLVKMERSEISLMLLGICRQNQGNLPEAVRLFNAAILAAPERADLHIYLASVYKKMGKSDDAEIQMQRAQLLNLKVPQPK